MIAAALLALVLVAIGLLVAIAVLVWLVVYLVRSRGDESDAGDDWMDIADVVSDDHAASLRVDDDDHYAEDYALLNRVGSRPRGLHAARGGDPPAQLPADD